MAAAFSAIISVGELVLPDVMVGITEASATRRPCDAVHRAGAGRPRRAFVAAHAARADGVEDRGGDVAGGVRQLLVALDSSAGRNSSGRYFASDGMRRCCA